MTDETIRFIVGRLDKHESELLLLHEKNDWPQLLGPVIFIVINLSVYLMKNILFLIKKIKHVSDFWRSNNTPNGIRTYRERKASAISTLSSKYNLEYRHGKSCSFRSKRNLNPNFAVAIFWWPKITERPKRSEIFRQFQNLILNHGSGLNVLRTQVPNEKHYLLSFSLFQMDNQRIVNESRVLIPDFLLRNRL